MKKIVSLALVLSMLVPCLAACGGGGKLEKSYKEAIGFIEEKDYESAYKIFLTLGDYKDAEKYLSSFHFLPTNKVVKDFGGEHVTELVLDKDGRPNKILEHDDYCVLELSYDSNGNVVRSVLRGTNGEYTYDQNGNLIAESYSNSDGTDSYEYVYDEEGRVIEETIESTDSDGSDLNIEVIKYTYNSDGELIRKEIEEDGEKIVITNTYETILDDSGKPIRKTYKQEIDGHTTEEEAAEYVYDADGRLIKESIVTKDYGTFGYDYQLLRVIDNLIEYVYDDDGNLISKTSVFEREGKKTQEKKIEYTYDESGKLIKEIKRDESFGGTFVEMGFELTFATWLYIDETYYGENGNITRRTQYRDHDGVTTEQRFDDYGNMIYQKNDHETSELMRYEVEITYVLVYLPDISIEILDGVEEEMLMHTWKIEE